MRLPPKNSGGSSTVSVEKTSGVSSNYDNMDTRASLQEIFQANFSVLEDNINDIIAFEKAADQKEDKFEKSRKMYASPSERFMMTSPQAAKKNPISKPSPIVEAKKRLSLTSDSSWRSKPKDGSGGPPRKRMSLTSDSSWMKSSKDNDDGGVIVPSNIRRNSVHSISSNHSNGSWKKPVPSNKLIKKPSARALFELKELTKKFDSEMELDELRKELELASKNYEIFGSKAPFGIDDSQRSDALDASKKSTGAKRISFQKDLRKSLTEDNALGAIKEALVFFETSLLEYTEQQDHSVSESGTEDTSKDNHLTKEIDMKRPSMAKERRLSDVTLDTALSNEKGKRPSHIVTVEDAEEEQDDGQDEKMKAAKDMVYASAGRSMQASPSNDSTPVASGGGGDKLKEKSKFGENLSKFFKAIQAWIQRRIEAFVASFTPKEKMIVKQMG